MFENFDTLDKYPSFTMTNGMILLELMQQKNIGFDHIFPILGSKGLVIEIISGKRLLKSSQIKQLAELFGINQDVFEIENGNIEHPHLGSEENSHVENSFLDMEPSNEMGQEENRDPHNELDGRGQNEENLFGNHQEPGMKPYWED